MSAQALTYELCLFLTPVLAGIVVYYILVLTHALSIRYTTLNERWKCSRAGFSWAQPQPIGFDSDRRTPNQWAG